MLGHKLKKFWKSSVRGRPGSGYSPEDRRVIEYLALFAVKHDIDVSGLLNCITEAYVHGKSEFKKLNVKCRQRNDFSAIFLLTIGSSVIAQFPISTGIFRSEKRIEGYIKKISARISLKPKKNVNPRIEDLKAGMKNVVIIAVPFLDQ